MYTKYIPDFESLLIPASISPWQHWMSRLNLSYFFACLSCTSFPKQCRFCLIWLLGIVVQQPELFWNLKCAAQCGNLKCTDSCINQIPELLWLRWSVSDCVQSSTTNTLKKNSVKRVILVAKNKLFVVPHHCTTRQGKWGHTYLTFRNHIIDHTCRIQ